MGFAYAGETGLAAGGMWAMLCNYQRALAWYKRPWTHAVGMAVCYYGFQTAAKWEDMALAVSPGRVPSPILDFGPDCVHLVVGSAIASRCSC